MNLFKQFWTANSGGELFEKSENLTKAELVQIQEKIADLQKRGLPSSKIISALQRYNKKLSKKYRAERVFWTGLKAQDTQLVAQAGEDIGITKYKVILSPSACKFCREKTNNGEKIFHNADVEKSGYGHVPPFHPSCFCIFIPQS